MGARGVELSNRRQFRRDRTLPPGGCSVRCLRGQTGKRSSPNLRRRLGMDAQRLLALSRLPRCSRRAWRVQRQIHVQPIRPARWFVRDIPHSYPPHLSQFLSTGKTLAVHWNQTRTRRTVNRLGASLCVRQFNNTMTGDPITAPPQVSGPESADFLADVIAGLSSNPRTIPSKYFYDERGAALFQKICELAEYYVTRAEIDILDRHRADIASQIGPSVELIGLGTGAGTKTRNLIEALENPAVYIPVDISENQLRQSTALFQKIFPDLEILPVCADYLQPVVLPSPRHRPARNVVYFPGSTIGNFAPDEALEFLRRIANVSGRGGGLLIGVDLQKDQNVIEAAYNDSAGVTAQFNLNLLVRLNREVSADFDPSHWRHRAIYNSQAGRIEMYLISATDQTVHIGDREFRFRVGEKILTEHSYKHTPEGFIALASQAGFDFVKLWTDDARLFGVFYFNCS